VDGVILSGARTLPQAELMQRVLKAASGFRALGIGEDDAVALFLRNDFAFLEAAMAASYVGAYAVPVNWHYTPDEAGYVLRDCAAKALVIHADLLPRIAGAVPAGVRVLVAATPPEIRAAYGIAEAAGRVAQGQTDWDAWVAGQAPTAAPPTPPRTSMIYTSGTTGRPKGVKRQPQTPEMQKVMAEMVSTIFDIRPGEKIRTVVTGPMYHSAPNLYGLVAARDGGFTILQPRFDPEELLALIERHRITHLHMVPTMFVRLLKLPDAVKRKYDLASLRFVVHAAAPCPAEVKRQMIEWWGPVINEYYGATETGGVVFHSSAEALAKPGTVGRPHRLGIVKIYDDAWNVLPAGQIGEVYLGLEGWPDFTYHNRDGERRACERDGLITAGDVGYLDADGYLFLCDRKKDMVISGGVNIYPAEIEAVLIGMPGVKDCAVFGIPDEEFGEALAAHVVGEVSAEQVKGYLRRHVAGFKVPKLVEIAKELPREDSGKIFKRKLREPYWQSAGRQI